MKNWVCVMALCLLSGWDDPVVLGQQPPAPRSLPRTGVTGPDELLPNARIVVRRPFKWIVGGKWGLGLTAGERLLIVGDRMHPWVVEALARAAREMGVKVDVFVRNMKTILAGERREEFDYERFDPLRYMGGGGIQSRAVPDWLARMAGSYDVVVGFNARGARYGRIGSLGEVRSTSMGYLTPQQLASPAVSFPDELHQLIAMKTWLRLVGGKRFHIRDPRGSDLTFTIDETNLERFAQTRGRVTYGWPTLRFPLAHEISLQLEPNLNQEPDASGVIVSRQTGYIPEGIRIFFEGGEVSRVEGGGPVGRNIAGVLEEFKDVQYPGYYPGPGVGWLEEIALGVNPKVGPEGFLRRRSGMLQVAFGTDRYNLVRDEVPTLPTHHRDINLFEAATLEVDGTKLVDRGHLTVLDDPEVRRLAARYGDSDLLLREDWIPEFDPKTGQIVYPPVVE